MTKVVWGLFVVALLTGCTKKPAEPAAQEGPLAGPYPRTVRGTIGSSYPLEDDSGRIKLLLLEYDNAAILVSAQTYDEKGMEADDAEVSLMIEPLPKEQCGDAAKCFKGY